ncbi:protein-L-isoaspartate O-methyltransferase [Aliidongia dinghuensis]|uniref:Protein-L-isoaspartate O-methyltransferase n=1 Tax=Aliidongia dinghuensis TaxID=1867774 RepID=A0A8J3E352_9PROT|nr:protein-L-isoaspartate O-methyltransferase [Aliidongia dinghuensis]GGF13521.1 protein-L-isoaspartate O-methyltransferase [Aliidongia dinghuensis]
MTDYAKVRMNMVESQIRPNKVTDPAVLSAFLEVPRELFVPEALRGAAYIDEDLPVGGNRFLMEPMVLARLLQTAAPRPTEQALVVASGAGYDAAILGRLVQGVVAVEADAALAEAARAAFTACNTGNVTQIVADPAAGHPAKAPYDVILLAGSVRHLPDALTQQLAEGGRLVGVVKTGEGAIGQASVGQAVLIERGPGGFSRRVLFDAAVAELPGFEPAPAFVF